MIKDLAIVGVIIICLPWGSLAEALTGSPDDPTTGRWIHDIRVGVLVHDVDNLWSGYRKEEGVDYNAEMVF